MSAQQLYGYDSDNSQHLFSGCSSWESFSDYEDLSPSCAQCEDYGDSNDELDGDFFEDNLTSNDMLNEGIKRDS